MDMGLDSSAGYLSHPRNVCLFRVFLAQVPIASHDCRKQEKTIKKTTGAENTTGTRQHMGGVFWFLSLSDCRLLLFFDRIGVLRARSSMPRQQCLNKRTIGGRGSIGSGSISKDVLARMKLSACSAIKLLVGAPVSGCLSLFLSITWVSYFYVLGVECFRYLAKIQNMLVPESLSSIHVLKL